MEAKSSQRRSRSGGRTPDNYELGEDEEDEGNGVSSCYSESMLKFSFMSLHNRSPANDTFYRIMGKNVQLRKTKRKKEANVDTYHKTPIIL